MKVLMLGAGAVGLSVAAKLSGACEVRAVARNRSAKAIEAKGFRLSGIWGEGNYRFPVGEGVPEGERFDYAILSSKAIDTRAICEQFSSLLRGTETVSLQNGIGNEEIIAEYTDKVIGGTIITGSEWRGDAAVHVSVEAGPIKVGRFPAGLDAPVTTLVELFRRAGMRAEASPTIRTELWAKTLYNCALNPLGAMMGVPYGALAEASAWRIIEGVVRECFAVIEAEGVALPWPRPEDYLAFLKDAQLPSTAAHRSSMFQDLSKGKATEIGFLNGAVVERGAMRGIATPVNACLVDLIRFRETLR